MFITVTYKSGVVDKYPDAKLDIVTRNSDKFLQFSTETISGFGGKVKEVHNINLDEIRHYKTSFHVDDNGKPWYN